MFAGDEDRLVCEVLKYASLEAIKSSLVGQFGEDATLDCAIRRSQLSLMDDLEVREFGSFLEVDGESGALSAAFSRWRNCECASVSLSDVFQVLRQRPHSHVRFASLAEFGPEGSKFQSVFLSDSFLNAAGGLFGCLASLGRITRRAAGTVALQFFGRRESPWVPTENLCALLRTKRSLFPWESQLLLNVPLQLLLFFFRDLGLSVATVRTITQDAIRTLDHRISAFERNMQSLLAGGLPAAKIEAFRRFLHLQRGCLLEGSVGAWHIVARRG